MCLLLREALTVGKVAFSSAFFSTELGVATAKRELKDELETYSVLVEPPKTTFGKVCTAHPSPPKHAQSSWGFAT